MCGIFGIFFFDFSKKVNALMVKDATDIMSHRGPDDSGYFVDGNVGLGHRRLSIIDLSSGHQPMTNEDGHIITVYNGEIYNYREIKNELTAKGHVFCSDCDTEVIVHAYEEWGKDCVNRFNGMFAFVLWDNRKKVFWVVRDRLGIKPLYYYHDKEVFICSSEIKPILKTGLIKAELNENVLDSYFSVGYVPGVETVFKSIRKVLPGHYLEVANSGLRDSEYWDFATVEDSCLDFGDAGKKLDEILNSSIGKRLMSDVPLGAFLSGGLDSSSVVSVLGGLVEKPVNTITFGYAKEYGESEEEYAEIVAEKYGTVHHSFRLTPDDFLSSVKTLVNYSEEPIVEPAAIALYHIAKLARDKAIVLLSGEGSDEIFGGYFLYQRMARIDNIQKIIPPWFWRQLNHARFLIPATSYRKLFDWLCLPLNQRYQGTSSYLTENIKKEIYADDFISARGDYLQRVFSSYFDRVSHKKDPLSKMLYVDTKTWLPDRLLLKADKMTMAASVELRVPFLDHELVEFASSLPSLFKIKDNNGKYILKSIMADKLPEAIINRKKMGFPVPTRKWFAEDLYFEIEDILMTSHKLPWINKGKLKKIFRQQRAGREDHSQLIMSLLVLIYWQEEYV